MDEPAPTALRARLALAHPPRRQRPRLQPLGLLAGFAAVVGAVVVVTVSGAGGAPTVLEAALVTVSPPQAQIGTPHAGGQTVPGVSGAGLSYPYWDDNFGYRAVGVSRNHLDSRTVTTVYYAHGPSRVAYGIVSGAPLSLGRAGQRSVRHGVVLWTLSDRHGAIVTWVRDGHTCVLTSASAGIPAMLRLAAWRHGGRASY